MKEQDFCPVKQQLKSGIYYTALSPALWPIPGLHDSASCSFPSHVKLQVNNSLELESG